MPKKYALRPTQGVAVSQSTQGLHYGRSMPAGSWETDSDWAITVNNEDHEVLECNINIRNDDPDATVMWVRIKDNSTNINYPSDEGIRIYTYPYSAQNLMIPIVIKKSQEIIPLTPMMIMEICFMV